MPKRRTRTAAQIAAQRKAARASALKRAREARAKANAAGSYSHPINKKARQTKRYYAAKKRGENPATPPGFGGRRTKQGGKAYVAKTDNNFKPSAEALAILAGKAGFRDRKTSERESHEAMVPLKQDKYGHNSLPKGMKVPVPKPEWRRNYSGSKPPGYKGPSQLHGSGTGLTSAYRYLKPLKGKK